MNEAHRVKGKPSELTLDGPRPFDTEMTDPTQTEIQTSTVAQSEYPKHRWSLAERVTLYLLDQDYQNNWSDVVSVFNAYHRETLASPRGLTEGVLRSQAAWIKCFRPNRSNQVLVQDLLAAFLLSLTSVEDIKSTLEAAAITAGIRLVRVIPTTANKSHASTTPRQAHQRNHSSLIPSNDSDSDNEDDNIALPYAHTHGGTDHIESLTPKTLSSNVGFLTPPDTEPRRKSCTLVASSPTPIQATRKHSTIYSLALPRTFTSRKQERFPRTPESPTRKRVRRSHPQHPARSLSSTGREQSCNSTPQELPILGFRGFSDQSQGINTQEAFKAGLFVNTDVTPCPPVEGSEYQRAAILHVERDRSFPSPLISVTKNPIRAIMRACALKRKSESYVAVLDLHKINHLGILQLAGSLNLQPRIRYDASGEVLIWGEIQKEAIISVIPVQKLIDTPPTQPGDDDPLEIETISKSWRAYFARSAIGKNKQSLSFFAGSAVGQLVRALELPVQYMEAAVGCILKDWDFEQRNHLKWQENKIFCDGINHGYTGCEIAVSSVSSEADAASSYDDTMDDAFLNELMEAAFGPSGDSLEEEVKEDPVETVRDNNDVSSGTIGVESQDVETQTYTDDVEMFEKPEDDWAWTGM